MSVEWYGLFGVILMFALMFFRVPIAISMAVPAVIGIYFLKDWKVLSTAINSIVWGHSFSYNLSTIPMFVLMGELLYMSGISGELFTTFRAWFGRLRGGLSVATIGASAVFAAASGSSVATTGTLGVLASKEMVKAGYNKSLSGGSIVAGGTLGILIPPSTLLIIYGMLTEQSIGALFIAGILPGILLTLMFMLTTLIIVSLQPAFAPQGEQVSWKERFISLGHIIWILILFLLVIGGMYVGWFSPTESAGVGAVGAFVIALLRRKLTFRTIVEALKRTLRTTGFIFAIVLAAFILNYFFAITRLPMALASVITDTGLPAWVVFFMIIVIYIILGAIMDTMAMIVVTIPIVLPVVQALGFDLVWFGIIIVLVVEMALLSPPVGMNCFVLKGVAPDLQLGEIFKGALWFMIPILATIILLYLFPQIVMYLPNTMY